MVFNTNVLKQYALFLFADFEVGFANINFISYTYMPLFTVEVNFNID